MSCFVSSALIIVLVCVCPGHPSSKWLQEGAPRSECAITRRVIRSQELGEHEGGIEFDDRITAPLEDLVTIDGVQSISLSYSNYLESLQVTYKLSNYSSFQAPRHGTLKSSEVQITFAHREVLAKVEGYQNGSAVQQISFTTEIFGTDNNKTTHVYGPYGGATTGSTPFSIQGYVVGFYGCWKYSGSLISVGMYALAPLSKSEEFGGESGSHLTPFDDTPDDIYAPTSRINTLYISHGDAVDSFRTIYSVLGGDILQTYPHGGPGGNESAISLTKDEAIIGMEGSSAGKYINHLSFMTRRGNDGAVTKYGPFGKPASKTFSFYGNILGFSGSFSDLLNRISVYYT